MNLPPGCCESDIDRAAAPDEPEYDWSEADLEEAYLDVLLIDAESEEKRMERWAA